LLLKCVIVLVHIFALLNYFVIGSMAVPNDNQFVRHPKDHGGIGPFLPAEPQLLCYCGLPIFVKQSKHPTLAGRAFYCCQLKQRPPTVDAYLEDAASISGSMAIKCLRRRLCCFLMTTERVFHIRNLFVGFRRHQTLQK
jgi:hypothetical protein